VRACVRACACACVCMRAHVHSPGDSCTHHFCYIPVIPGLDPGWEGQVQQAIKLQKLPALRLAAGGPQASGSAPLAGRLEVAMSPWTWLSSSPVTMLEEWSDMRLVRRFGARTPNGVLLANAGAQGVRLFALQHASPRKYESLWGARAAEGWRGTF